MRALVGLLALSAACASSAGRGGRVETPSLADCPATHVCALGTGSDARTREEALAHAQNDAWAQLAAVVSSIQVRQSWKSERKGDTNSIRGSIETRVVGRLEQAEWLGSEATTQASATSPDGAPRWTASVRVGISKQRLELLRAAELAATVEMSKRLATEIEGARAALAANGAAGSALAVLAEAERTLADMADGEPREKLAFAVNSLTRALRDAVLIEPSPSWTQDGDLGRVTISVRGPKGPYAALALIVQGSDGAVLARVTTDGAGKASVTAPLRGSFAAINLVVLLHGLASLGYALRVPSPWSCARVSLQVHDAGWGALADAVSPILSDRVNSGRFGLPACAEDELDGLEVVLDLTIAIGEPIRIGDRVLQAGGKVDATLRTNTRPSLFATTVTRKIGGAGMSDEQLRQALTSSVVALADELFRQLASHSR